MKEKYGITESNNGKNGAEKRHLLIFFQHPHKAKRGVFRILNIYDGVFSRKLLTTEYCWLFLQKNAIIDVWQAFI